MPASEGVNKHPTGVVGFDDLLGGGLPDGSLILIHGESGAGSHTFVQQILYNRAVSGGRVAYFNIEKALSDVVEDMSTQNMNINPIMEDGRWVFGDIYGIRYKNVKIGPDSIIPPQRSASIVDLLQGEIIKKMHEGCWTAIDSLSHLFFIHDLKDVINFIEIVTMSVRRYGGIHFLLFLAEEHDPSILATMKHMADGVIEMKMKPQSTILSLEGELRIWKMRRMPPAIRTVPFILTEKGILITR